MEHQQGVDAFLYGVEVALGPDVGAGHQQAVAGRITSYNVCYTKLLRAGALLQAAGGLQQDCWPHRITSYNVCYTKLLRGGAAKNDS